MKFRISSEYGELSPVRNMQPHHGIDLAMPEGTTLRSVGNGVIDRVYEGADAIGKGCSVQLESGNRLIYGHLNKVDVQVGDHVNAGDILGVSGSTGLSTGNHLHFALKNNSGEWIDPTPLADNVASISGDEVPKGLITKLLSENESHGMLWDVTEEIREKTADVATEVILGILDAIGELLLGFTLIGSAIMILLKVAGWKDGGRWTGVLIVVHVLIKFFAVIGG
jgi:hypothetical protein